MYRLATVFGLASVRPPHRVYRVRQKMQKNICICSDSLLFLLLRYVSKGKMGQNSNGCGMILR